VAGGYTMPSSAVRLTGVIRSLAPICASSRDSPAPHSSRWGAAIRWFTFQVRRQLQLCRTHGFLGRTSDVSRNLVGARRTGNGPQRQFGMAWLRGAACPTTHDAESSSPPHDWTVLGESRRLTAAQPRFAGSRRCAPNLNQSNSYGEGLVRACFTRAPWCPCRGLSFSSERTCATHYWDPCSCAGGAGPERRRSSGQRRRRKPQHFAHRKWRAPSGRLRDRGSLRHLQQLSGRGLGRLPAADRLVVPGGL